MRLGGAHHLAAGCVRLRLRHRPLRLVGAGAHGLGRAARARKLALDSAERLLGLRHALLDRRDAVGGAQRLRLGGAGGLLGVRGARLCLGGGVGRGGGMRARRVGGLLGLRRQPLDRGDGVGRQGCAAPALPVAPVRRSCASSWRSSPSSERDSSARCALVADRAHQRVQLGVRVGEVAGQHPVLLDPLARERVELGADLVELQAQALPLLRAARGPRRAPPPSPGRRRPSLARRGRRPAARPRSQSPPRARASRPEPALQVRPAVALADLPLELLDARARAARPARSARRGASGAAALERGEPRPELVDLVARAASRGLARARPRASPRAARISSSALLMAASSPAWRRDSARFASSCSTRPRVSRRSTSSRWRSSPAARSSGDLGFERVDLLARGAQLGEVRARLLELGAQMLLCLRRPGQLALEPLGERARLLDRRAGALAAPPRTARASPRARGGCRRAPSRAPRCGRRPWRSRRAPPRPRRAPPQALRWCPRARAPGRPTGRARPPRRRRSARPPRRWRRGHPPRAGAERAEARSAGGRRRSFQPRGRPRRASRGLPIAALTQSTTVLWLRCSCRSALPRGAAISSASRKPLNSRLWLIPTGMNVSVSSSSGPVLAARDRLDDAAELGQVAGEGERVDERASDHARARPAEQLLGGPGPARYGAVAIRENEAGIDELTQQLLDGLRLGGRGTRLLLGHVSISVGRRPR